MAKKTNKKKKINKKIVSKNNSKLKTSQSAKKKDTLEKNKHYLSNNNLGTNKINSQKSKVVSKPDNKRKSSKKALKKILKPKKSFICLLFIILGITLFIVLNNMKYNKKDLEKFNKNDLIIKLNGEQEVTIEYGNTYQDKGANAYYKEIDLTSKIDINTNINFKKIGKYFYEYKIKYNGLSKSVKRNVTIKDTKKPSITLNGDKEMFVYLGTSYIEKGAKAIDNYDGDISKKVNISGSVNSKKEGKYTITYKVNDSSGNEASIKRIVTVKQKQNNNSNSNNESSTNVIGKSSKGFIIEKRNGLYYIGGILVVNKSYDLPSTYNPGGLQNIFNTNFNKMKNAAKNDGVELKVISGFRSYSYQNTIYNRYVKNDGKEEADRYSARPGHSEHQTGLAADINKISYTWGETKEGKWLNDNCYKYGFVIRYPEGSEEKTGYKFEPWHIRYLGVDVATKLYNNGNWITLEEYLGITSKYNY